MSNTYTPEAIKSLVKSHNVISFSAQDIACSGKTLTVQDRYVTTNPTRLMETLGIRKNLSKDIFNKPKENWPIIQTALNGISAEKRFGAIVTSKGEIITLVKAPQETCALDYDTRIDELMNTLDRADRELQNIAFIPDTADVRVNTIARNQVDCGQGDLWKYGTTADIGYISQQFNNYFLRLICTNGMVTQENLAYRLLANSDKIGTQFFNFTRDESFIKSITPRVDALRNSRASFYELNSVARNLTADQRDSMLPEYADTVQGYKARGHNIEDMPASRQKFVYTNTNLYDVFNRATDLASHHTDVLDSLDVRSLNKTAAEMFIKGPNLAISILDIYNN